MTDSGPSAGLPLALVAGEEEGSAGRIEELLNANGFAVLRTPTGQHALARARTTNPDVVFIEAVLPDRSGLELCRTMLQGAHVTKSTPIIITTPHNPTREQRIEALRAGAWDCVGPATDGVELTLKLHAHMRAKLDADRSRAQGLLDAATGLYNRQGMARRVQELGSYAFREHGSLACVVLALDLDPDAIAAGDSAADAILKSVQVLKSSGRLSDVLGRLGPTEFTSEAGQQPPVREVRVGYEAVSNVGYAPLQPVDLLIRASAALRRGTAEGGRSWIRRYDDGTTGSTGTSAPSSAP